MTDACDFIDAALRYEGSDDRAAGERERLGSDLRFYGASVGAIRGTIRDAVKRYPDLTRDESTALCSELWAEPVYERRRAAIVLLQSMLPHLDNGDLTRIEGFLRQADIPALREPLAADVVVPLIAALNPDQWTRASRVLSRWATDSDATLRRVADDAFRIRQA